MTNKRYFAGGGGTLNPRLCISPKGGVTHDCEKHGRSMPVPCRRLLADREPDASGYELARHKLGTPTGPDADGCQRYLPRGQRGWRSTAYAHVTRNPIPSASTSWLVVCVSGRSLLAICTNPSLRPNRQHGYDNPSSGWRSAAQQFAPVPLGVPLAADGVSTPERGCAA